MMKRKILNVCIAIVLAFFIFTVVESQAENMTSVDLHYAEIQGYKMVQEFWKNGKLRAQIWYDKNGTLMKELDYDIAGNPGYIRTFGYNGENNVERVNYYDVDGVYISYIHFEYDQEGRMIKQIDCYPDDTLIDYWVFEYEGNQIVNQIQYSADGSVLMEKDLNN